MLGCIHTEPISARIKPDDMRANKAYSDSDSHSNIAVCIPGRNVSLAIVSDHCGLPRNDTTHGKASLCRVTIAAMESTATLL